LTVAAVGPIINHNNGGGRARPAGRAGDSRMKAEERKHLTTNSLAQGLSNFLEKAKQGPSRRTLLIVGVIALAVALFFTWRYFSNRADEKSSARSVAWFTLGDTPGDPESKLKSFIDDKDNEGTSQARVARFDLARLRLTRGVRFIGSQADRAAARDELAKAAEDYEKLQAETSDSPHLQQEALLNAGKARESLGDYAAAKKHYEALIKAHDKSAAGQEAKRRLDFLNDHANAEELDALAAELKK
jgi:hypothetical protein